jgi:hypothetical protein
MSWQTYPNPRTTSWPHHPTPNTHHPPPTTHLASHAASHVTHPPRRGTSRMRDVYTSLVNPNWFTTVWMSWRQCSRAISARCKKKTSWDRGWSFQNENARWWCNCGCRTHSSQPANIPTPHTYPTGFARAHTYTQRSVVDTRMVVAVAPRMHKPAPALKHVRKHRKFPCR